MENENTLGAKGEGPGRHSLGDGNCRTCADNSLKPSRDNGSIQIMVPNDFGADRAGQFTRAQENEIAQILASRNLRHSGESHPFRSQGEPPFATMRPMAPEAPSIDSPNRAPTGSFTLADAGYGELICAGSVAGSTVGTPGRLLSVDEWDEGTMGRPGRPSRHARDSEAYDVDVWNDALDEATSFEDYLAEGWNGACGWDRVISVVNEDRIRYSATFKRVYVKNEEVEAALESGASDRSIALAALRRQLASEFMNLTDDQAPHVIPQVWRDFDRVRAEAADRCPLENDCRLTFYLIGVRVLERRVGPASFASVARGNYVDEREYDYHDPQKSERKGYQLYRLFNVRAILHVKYLALFRAICDYGPQGDQGEEDWFLAVSYGNGGDSLAALVHGY